MPEIETMLAELFGAQLFEKDPELQAMIDDTLSRYSDGDGHISLDELSAAAGGLSDIPADSKGDENK